MCYWSSKVLHARADFPTQGGAVTACRHLQVNEVAKLQMRVVFIARAAWSRTTSRFWAGYEGVNWSHNTSGRAVSHKCKVCNELGVHRNQGFWGSMAALIRTGWRAMCMCGSQHPITRLPRRRCQLLSITSKTCIATYIRTRGEFRASYVALG